MEYFGFSIVIANFNSGKFLEEALLSVFSQNYPNYELIVMDGGSTDNSVEIIKKYEDKIAYWQSKEDKGQSDAFNQGFAKATKEWLFWLNADDFLLKDSLFRLNDKMHMHDGCNWFVFDECIVDVNGRCVNVGYAPQWSGFFEKKVGPVVPSPTSIFHRDLYFKSQGFDLKLYWAMDNDLWFQFYNLGEKFVNIHEYLYGFRINENSKTFSEGYKTKRSEERVRQTIYSLEKNNINIQYHYLKYWRIVKLFTVALPRIINNIKYRNKNMRWWM